MRASSPAGFKPKKRMTTHENNGIQGAISKKAEPIQDLPFFFGFGFEFGSFYPPDDELAFGFTFFNRMLILGRCLRDFAR